MTSLPSFVLVASLLAPAIALADDCAPAAATRITLTRDSATVLARYDFGAPLKCIRFADRGDVRKLSWQVESPGATLSSDGDIVSFKDPSRHLTVRLSAFKRDGQMDRVYSPLIAFGDGKAVALYSPYLTPANTARGVSFRFRGFAPTAPGKHPGAQNVGAGKTYLVVGQPTIERRGKVALVLDQAMPAWLLRSVTRNIAQGETALRAVKPASAPLSYLVTYTEPAREGANWRGDVLDNLVRLNFMGALWNVEDPGKEGQVATFILHELFHTVISSALDPQLPAAMTLDEGAAEAGAMMLNRRLGNITASALESEIDSVTNRCQAIGGGTLAEREKRSQRTAPYTCGPALQFMVAKAANAPAPDPLALWTAVLASAGHGNRGWPALFTAAESGAQPNLAALATLRQMTASSIGWDEGMQGLAAHGLLRRRTSAELADPSFSSLFTSAAIMPMLSGHCKASYGFYDQAPVFVLDAQPGSCGPVPHQFRLLALNGHRLAAHAYQAHLETARRCTANLPLELEDDQGRKMTVPCSTPVRGLPIYTLF